MNLLLLDPSQIVCIEHYKNEDGRNAYHLVLKNNPSGLWWDSTPEVDYVIKQIVEKSPYRTIVNNV